MKLRTLLTFMLLLIAGTAMGAYPYDSVGVIAAPAGRGFNMGSGTLIGVSHNRALVLTCKHVVLHAGRTVYASWSVTDKTYRGRCIAVGANQDIALCVFPAPPGLRPVRVSFPVSDNGPFVNVGYPGASGSLEWQEGAFAKLTNSRFYYTARPVPGMSGGATFDRRGYLVGVITNYTRSGGISSSGYEMLKFLQRYRFASSWHYPPVKVQYGGGKHDR